ncbi:zinc finger protein ZFP2-like isoform X2 [Diachasmimorpha longicaudata]|uniref:zinc finger protein ZFP2-like isoform X2 n=1 Tax=Diachasmimorpha longicaudata TaxID=58733 RepID=UPI0030B8AEB1
MTIITTMCTRLFSCPLCTQPSFNSLDSLRIGLVSVATRPLTCPICNDTVLGIDKLTIHLFGHTITENRPNELQPLESKNRQFVKTNGFEVADSGGKCGNSVIVLNETSSIIHLKNPHNLRDDSSISGQFIATVPVVFNGMREETSAPTTNVAPQPRANDPEMTVLNVDTVPQSDTDPWQENLLSETPEECNPDGFHNQNIDDITTNEISTCETVPRSIISSAESSLHIPEPCNVHFPNTNAKCHEEEIQSDLLILKEHSEDRKSSAVTNGTLNDKRERCNICGLSLVNRNSLILHKQLAHKIAAKDCNIRPEDLLKNYPCHLCSKVFKMRGSLMIHMRVAHTGGNLATLGGERNSDGGFNCPLCGKNFKKEQHVTQHLKTHEGKQWECDVCSKMFTTKYFLKKHKRLHSGEMPYQCNICNKTFTFQQSYHKHRLYHKDDKPHTCTVCGRSFKELSTLHNHERIHTGEKPFACETCGKCFRQRVSYLVHRRIHTGVMPYTCSACGKSFRYKVSQRTHKCPGQSDGHEQPSLPSVLDQIPEPPSSEPQINAFALDKANKFVVIPNSNGEPTLTREMDINPLNSTNMFHFTPHPDPPEIDDRGGSAGAGSTGGVQLPEDHSQDFLSLVMSPMQNDPSSPTTEMQHLRLASPKQSENCQESDQQYQDPSDNLQKDLKHAIDGILNERNRENNSLETINEESLKELLYGINKTL